MDAQQLTDDTNGTIAIGDMTVRRMGFGAMRLTGEGVWGPPADRPNAVAVLRRAVDRGVNFIDTAEAYGPGDNEELIAEALHPYASNLLIATKGGLARTGPGAWVPAGTPDELRSGCEASLRRLKCDTIDLYQLHTLDPAVPLADAVGALAELKDQGKIRNIGLSNVNADELRQAQAITPIASVQNNYNVLNREHEPVLTVCEETRAAFIAYFPLAADGGFKTITATLDEVAGTIDATAMQVALAWLLQRSPQMLVIPGTSQLGHLDQNIDAAFVDLPIEGYERLAAHTPAMGGLLKQLGTGEISEAGQARLAESKGAVARLWDRLRFWD